MVAAVPDRRRSTSFLQKWLVIMADLLRLVLWPVRRVSEVLLPAGEFDGLSPAVTEKAAQQFVNHLKTLAPTTQHASINRIFSTTGLAALKQEAAASNSILVLYLHAPLHRQADDFLKKLISPPMLEFLNQDNVKTLGSSIHTSQGAHLSFQLRASSFPLLVMLQPGRGSSDGDKLVFKAEGPTLLKMQPAQLLPLMNGTYQRHQMGAAEEVARRMEREQETDLRRQQDEEYQETLRADQERERLRQEEREREEHRIQEEEDRERRQVQAEQDRLDKAKALLRPEPSSGGTRIRFALPSGKKLERRFGNDETVGTLKAYLILHFSDENSAIKNIALSTNFPKKTYTQDEQTLTESELAPQAVLMVQDLDA